MTRHWSNVLTVLSILFAGFLCISGVLAWAWVFYVVGGMLR